MKRRTLLLVSCVLVIVAISSGVSLAVVSSPVSTQSTTSASSCANLPFGETARDCYVNFLLSQTENADNHVVAVLDEATLLLSQAGQAGHHFGTECHEVLHVVGAEKATLGHVEFEDVPIESCLNGYIHGVLEHLFIEYPDYQLFDAAAQQCTMPDGDAVCDHFVGHLFVDRHPGEPVETVLRLCNPNPMTTVLDEQVQALRCLDGAFMEFSLDERRNQRWRGDPESTAQQCRRYAEAEPLAAEACYSQIGPKLYIANDGDTHAGIRVCLDEPVNEALSRACVLSVTNFLVTVEGTDVQLGIELCSEFDEQQQVTCASGIDRARYSVRGQGTEPDTCYSMFSGDKEQACLDLTRQSRWSVAATNNERSTKMDTEAAS